MRPVLGRHLLLAKAVASMSAALVVVGCSGSSDDRSPSAAHPARPVTTTGERAAGSSTPRRPTAIDASIAVLPNGHSRREVVLRNVQVPSGASQGTAISIHPTSDPLTVEVPDLPAGGNLLVCPVDGPNPPVGGGTTWVRTPEPCATISSVVPTSMRLSRADGNSHVGIEFDGDWAAAINLAEVRLDYEAVDDHFYVDFALP